MIVLGLGLGDVVRTDHDRGHQWRRERQLRLASGLLNTTQQVGGSLGLAVLSSETTSRTTSALDGWLLHSHVALTHGFKGALYGRGEVHFRRRCGPGDHALYRAAGASPKTEQVEAMTISFIRCPGAPYCGHLARVVAFGRRMRGALPRSWLAPPASGRRQVAGFRVLSPSRVNRGDWI